MCKKDFIMICTQEVQKISRPGESEVLKTVIKMSVAQNQ